MMKVLLINNTIFYRKHKSLFLNKETGAFFIRLKELGNKVSLFQISQRKTANDNFANFDIADKGMKVYEVKRKNNKLISFIKSFFIIQYAILKNEFVYIFYPGPICFVIALFCILYRRKYGLYIRGEQGILSKKSSYILKHASYVFTISPDFTEKIKKINNNVETIRPMITFDENDYFFDREIALRSRMNLLYVGRLVFDKGLFELIDAMEVLVQNYPNIQLNLVGDGSDRCAILSKIEEKKISNNVHVLGMISDKSDLRRLYKNSDVFILPTYHEGFPRVLYEAMIMQMPILTTFVGAISSVMIDRYNCIQIAPRDVSSIINGIKCLVEDDNISHCIAKNGLLTVEMYLSDKPFDHGKQLHKRLYHG